MHSGMVTSFSAYSSVRLGASQKYQSYRHLPMGCSFPWSESCIWDKSIFAIAADSVFWGSTLFKIELHKKQMPKSSVSRNSRIEPKTAPARVGCFCFFSFLGTASDSAVVLDPSFAMSIPPVRQHRISSTMELFCFYEKIIAYKTASNVYFLKILGQYRTKSPDALCVVLP